MSKNKSRLKEVTLKSLIIVPAFINSSLISIPVISYKGIVKNKIDLLGTDITNIKERTAEIIDVNIKRLEKVRNRIIESTINKKGQQISKIDTMISFFKKEKPKALTLNSLDELELINKEISKTADRNDIKLGKVFDGRKDGKKEKFYNKLGKKFHEIEKNINKFSKDRREDISKIIHKGNMLIEQLKNEEKKGKAKAETRKIRRELALVFNQLKFLV